VIVLGLAAVYDLLGFSDPGMAVVIVLVGCFIAGLVTAPEHADEGVLGFALGMVIAVGTGAIVSAMTGRPVSNPISAVIGLWILGPIGFIPGWVVGGRRHHAQLEAGSVRGVPRRSVPR
jgi:uncharacterized membrane protein